MSLFTSSRTLSNTLSSISSRLGAGGWWNGYLNWLTWVSLWVEHLPSERLSGEILYTGQRLSPDDTCSGALLLKGNGWQWVPLSKHNFRSILGGDFDFEIAFGGVGAATRWLAPINTITMTFQLLSSGKWDPALFPFFSSNCYRRFILADIFEAIWSFHLGVDERIGTLSVMTGLFKQIPKCWSFWSGCLIIVHCRGGKIMVQQVWQKRPLK